MIPRWLQLALGLVTDAEDAPRPCPHCGGTGWERPSAVTARLRYIQGDITLEEFERTTDAS